MSVEAVGWAFKEPELKTSEKIALVGLANFADEYGVCYPRQSTLCEYCSLAERTLRAALSELERRKLIMRLERRRPDGSRRSDVYLLVGFSGKKPILPSEDHAVLSPQDIVAMIDQWDSKWQDLPVDDPDLFGGQEGASEEASTGKSCRTNRQISPDQPANLAGIYSTEPSIGIEDEARASAPAFSDFVLGICREVGDPQLSEKKFWKLEAENGAFIEAWRKAGLSDDEILEVARSHAQNMPDPPHGPKGLDPAMRRKAEEKRPASSKKSAKAAQAKPVASADPKAIMRGRAGRILQGRDFLCRDITHGQAVELVAAGLVTAAQCCAVGVRVRDDDPAIEAARPYVVALGFACGETAEQAGRAAE